jgi:GAF domain-containing protein
MKRLAALFRTLTRIDVHYDDPFDQLQARSLSLIIWSLIGLAVLYLVYLVFSNITPAYIPLYVGTVALLVVGLSFVLYLIRRNGLVEARFVIITLSLVIIVLVYVSQPSPAGMLIFVLPVLVSGVMLNRRGIVAITLLSFAALLGITIVGVFGLVTGVVATSSAPLDSLGLGIFSVLATGLTLTIFSGGQRIVVQRNLVSTREFLNALAVTKSLAQSPSVEHTLNEAINAIRDQFGYYYVQAYLLERATGLPTLRARTGYGRRSVESSGDQSAQADQGQLTSDEFSVINEVLKAGKPLRLTRNDPERRRSQFLNTTQSELLLPIVWGDRVLGLLDVQSVSGDSFTARQTEMLEAIATELGMILANSQLTTDLKKTTQDHEQLTTQFRDASRQLEYLNQEVVVRNWRRYLQSRGDEALGFNWKDGSFSPDSAVTPSLERAFKASGPEIWDDGDEQVLGVPIILRGQQLGAMEFRTAKEQGWSSRSLDLARIISGRLALALDNIRLYEQAQILANREQMANQVAARLQTKTDVDALIEIATESFRDALGATRANIRLGIPGQQSEKNGAKS